MREQELKRLNFEDIIWIIFILLSILNIISNKCQKQYIISNNEEYEEASNKISIFVLIILLCIYTYFFNRNYTMYTKKNNPQQEDIIKVIGSILFILGTICLLYFQLKSENNFIGTREL